MKIYQAFLVTIVFVLVFNILNGVVWLFLRLFHLEGNNELVFLIGKLLLTVLFLVYFKRINFSLGPGILSKSISPRNVLFLFLIAVGTLIARRPFDDIIPIFNKILGSDNLFRYSPIQLHHFELVCKTITALAIAPIIEELVFRKFLLDGLLTKHSPLISILISSLCFSLIHLETPEMLIPAFFFGLVAGLVYYKTRQLSHTILLHFLLNLFVLLLDVYGVHYFFILYKMDFGIGYWLFVLSGFLILFLGFSRLTHIQWLNRLKR